MVGVPFFHFGQRGKAFLGFLKRGFEQCRVHPALCDLPGHPGHGSGIAFGFSRFAQAGAHRGVLMGFAVVGSYDASYLELALREGRPLVTLDADLQRAMMATDGVVI